MVRRHHQMTLSVLRAADLAVAAAAWGGGYLLRGIEGRLGLTSHPRPPFADFAPAMLFSLVLTVLIFSRFGLYERKRLKRLVSELRDLSRAVVIVWALTWGFAAFVPRQQVTVSRLMMLSVLAIWLLLGGLMRIAGLAVLRALRRRGWNVRYAAIVGTGRLGQKLYHCIRRNPWTGIEPLYFVAEGDGPAMLWGLPRVVMRGDLLAVLAQRPVNMVLLALPVRDHEKTEELLSQLTATDVEVQIVPDMLSFYFLGHGVSQLDDLPVITLTHTPLQGWHSALKRAFDLLVSAACLPLLALLMLPIALGIKWSSPGPVFYRQKRTSLGGRPFQILKFRTMVVDAEKSVGPVMAYAGDPRATRFGRFLRRTSLDELPQLLNVLWGDMSLVGPRPERPELIERFRHQVPRYMLRQHVKAGLTGWAQVHGLRGRTSLRKRIQYDLYYIRHWTFGLDLWILALTPFRGLVHPNAY